MALGEVTVVRAIDVDYAVGDWRSGGKGRGPGDDAFAFAAHSDADVGDANELVAVGVPLLAAPVVPPPAFVLAVLVGRAHGHDEHAVRGGVGKRAEGERCYTVLVDAAQCLDVPLHQIVGDALGGLGIGRTIAVSPDVHTLVLVVFAGEKLDDVGGGHCSGGAMYLRHVHAVHGEHASAARREVTAGIYKPHARRSILALESLHEIAFKGFHFDFGLLGIIRLLDLIRRG